MGANDNENLSVSTEECCRKAIHDVFGSNWYLVQPTMNNKGSIILIHAWLIHGVM